MYFKNPILSADFSDPDIIKVDDTYFLVASSFNYVKGVPVLASKDLVNFKIISYAIKKLPPFYNEVRVSNGAWAPSIQYHNSRFYIFIPFPDEGIFYTTSKNPFLDDWSELKPLYLLKGIEDPTVLFEKDKAYLVFAFVKSRIGFNSKLGLVEFTPNLEKQISKDYQIIFDGTNLAPTIEGPKLYKFNNYYYIFAPAFGVEHGKQMQLRSKNIKGEYTCITSLIEGNNINGPHQGGLVHIKDNSFAFIHFSYDDELGRITYLENAYYDYKKEYFILGNNSLPQKEGIIPTTEDKSFFIDYNDDFNSLQLKNIWQTPGNVDDYYLLPTSSGLIVNARKYSYSSLMDFPFILTQMFTSKSFKATFTIDISKIKGETKVGITLIGEEFNYLVIYKTNNEYYVEYYESNSIKDTLIDRKKIDITNIIELSLTYKNKKSSLSIDNLIYNKKGFVKKQHYIGLRLGIFICSNNITDNFIKILKYKIESEK